MQHIPTVRKHPAFRGRIGVAREDITPPIGIYSRNWGAAEHDVADAIHRPLTLTALTLAPHAATPSSTQDALVFVEADLGWWRRRELFEQFRARLVEDLSLDSARLVFALSHTHAAAPLMDSDPSVPGHELLKPWMEKLYQATRSAIQRSLAEAEESILDWHTGRCALAAVRDLPDPDPEAERMVCGFNPARPADETLLVGRVTTSRGGLRAVLVNYACHPTTLAWENTTISPDFVGAMRETIEQTTGATALFLQGMSGDLAPRQQYVGDVEVADRHGKQLGFAALATLHDMEPAGNQLYLERVVESGAPLAVWRHQPCEISTELRALERPVDVALKNWPSAAELEQQRLACVDRALAERLRRQRDIRRSLGDDASSRLAVHTWRIGDVAWVGGAGEAYSVLQQNLRRRFPQLSVVCMNLVNGWVGYLPPEELYDQDVYPVWQTPFDRGCLEQVTEIMIDAIEDLWR